MNPIGQDTLELLYTGTLPYVVREKWKCLSRSNNYVQLHAVMMAIELWAFKDICNDTGDFPPSQFDAAADELEKHSGIPKQILTDPELLLIESKRIRKELDNV